MLRVADQAEYEVETGMRSQADMDQGEMWRAYIAELRRGPIAKYIVRLGRRYYNASRRKLVWRSDTGLRWFCDPRTKFERNGGENVTLIL